MAELRNFILAYEHERGCAPSYKEMAKGLGLRSQSGIHRLVESLETRGVVQRNPSHARTVRIVPPADSIDVARKHIAYKLGQGLGMRDILIEIFQASPEHVSLLSAIEQVAVAWERLQEGEQ